MDERLPKENSVVITYQENQFHPECSQQILAFRDGYFIGLEDLYEVGLSGHYPGITHWQELQSPPKPLPQTPEKD